MKEKKLKQGQRFMRWSSASFRKEFLKWSNELEPQARLRDIEHHRKMRDHAKMIFHYEGSLIECKAASLWEPYERKGGGKRSTITGFSAASRRRLMKLCARIVDTALPLFVTLTYPREWPASPKVWKRHLDSFLKWLNRRNPEASGIWKLEAQKRGAPHYHLLVWGCEFIAHQDVARRWYEIVGSGDPRHLVAGTQVMATRNKRDVIAYASKRYMGKEVDGFEGVGRFWGVFNRKAIPASKVIRFQLTDAVRCKVVRVMRRFLASKGVTVKNNRSFTLFSKEHLLWSRVVDWAERGSC